MIKRLITTVLSFMLSFMSLPALAAAPSMPTSVQNEKISGQILVKFREGTPQNVIDLNLNQKGAKLSKRLDRLNVLVLNVPKNQEQIIAQVFSNLAEVEFAEPDFIAHITATTNDASLSQEWGMTKVQAENGSGPSAWDTTIGHSSVKIAILDTGIDQNHEDLAAKIVANQNFTTSPTVDDLYGHGSHVAGTAAAITNNATGVAGLGYNSALMNVKVLDDTGSGAYSWIANGITWATDNGAKVISMSLGGTSSSSTLQNAINYAWDHGVVVTAAAGNNGSSARFYPAYYSNTIAVAATDSKDAKASWSNYGSWVDVAAPGVNIYSTLPNHSNQIGTTNYGTLSGTSMATPHVAGLAALVWATGICSTNSCVRSQIQNNADPISGTGTYWTYGRVNAYKAVGGPTPSPSPAPSSSPTPTPTPTPSASPSPSPSPSSSPSPSPSPSPTLTLRASNINMWYQTLFNLRRIYTKVTVLNQNNSALSGANVSIVITYPNAQTATGSGSTASDGTITFQTSYTSQKGTYKANITNISKSGYTYDVANSKTTTTLLVN